MHFSDFFDTLPIMVKGMAGIFIVTGILIVCIYLLNRISNKKNTN